MKFYFIIIYLLKKDWKKYEKNDKSNAEELVIISFFFSLFVMVSLIYFNLNRIEVIRNENFYTVKIIFLIIALVTILPAIWLFRFLKNKYSYLEKLIDYDKVYQEKYKWYTIFVCSWIIKLVLLGTCFNWS